MQHLPSSTEKSLNTDDKRLKWKGYRNIDAKEVEPDPPRLSGCIRLPMAMGQRAAGFSVPKCQVEHEVDRCHGCPEYPTEWNK